jgi:hypothetical protein
VKQVAPNENRAVTWYENSYPCFQIALKNHANIIGSKNVQTFPVELITGFPTLKVTLVLTHSNQGLLGMLQEVWNCSTQQPECNKTTCTHGIKSQILINCSIQIVHHLPTRFPVSPMKDFSAETNICN